MSQKFVEACKSGDLEAVKKYLTKADIHYRDDEGFRFAAIRGHLDVVKYLVSSPELTEHANIYAADSTGICFAASHNQLEVVEYLLSFGLRADINDNYMVKICAAEGHLALLQYLLTQCETDIYDDYKGVYSAFSQAYRGQQKEVLKYLIVDFGYDLAKTESGLKNRAEIQALVLLRAAKIEKDNLDQKIAQSKSTAPHNTHKL